jgi:hypothetical protein
LNAKNLKLVFVTTQAVSRFSPTQSPECATLEAPAASHPAGASALLEVETAMVWQDRDIQILCALAAAWVLSAAIIWSF